MRRLALLLGVLAIAMFAACGEQADEATPTTTEYTALIEVTITNCLELWDIHYILIDPPDEAWSEDRLGEEEILCVGESFSVEIEEGTWDIMVTDEDGYTYPLWQVEIGSEGYHWNVTIDDLIIKWDEDEGIESTINETGDGSTYIVIANNLGNYDICWIYVDPTEAPWSYNRLVSDILYQDDKLIVWVDPGTYDIQIEDEDGDTYTLLEVEVDAAGFEWSVTLEDLDMVYVTGSNLPDGMEFVSIPTGSFQMGSPERDPDSHRSERPVHTVTFNYSFEMMTTEVTQGMWEEVMDVPAARYHEMSSGEGDNYPIYFVSWNDCQDFIDEMNDMDSNYTYRLPSEAEWEYACRAGTTTRFLSGDLASESTIGDYCWFYANSSLSTHPVGTKQPNAWGLYDMNGNVWEWCQDLYYHSGYSGAPTDGSARESFGDYRIKRGGNWISNYDQCRSSHRDCCSPDNGSTTGLGFRLARSVR